MVRRLQVAARYPGLERCTGTLVLGWDAQVPGTLVLGCFRCTSTLVLRGFRCTGTWVLKVVFRKDRYPGLGLLLMHKYPGVWILKVHKFLGFEGCFQKGQVPLCWDALGAHYRYPGVGMLQMHRKLGVLEWSGTLVVSQYPGIGVFQVAEVSGFWGLVSKGQVLQYWDVYLTFVTDATENIRVKQARKLGLFLKDVLGWSGTSER